MTDQNQRSEIFKEAYQLAMRKLTNREHASAELSFFLESKSIPKSVVADVLSYLSEKNYQSDARYAEMLVRSRFSRKYGPEKIKQELQIRQIDDGIIQSELKNYEGRWLNNLIVLLDKKAIGMDFTDRKDLEKVKRYLLSKGYRFDQINSALRNYF